MWIWFLLCVELVVGGWSLSIPDEFTNISSIVFKKSRFFVSSNSFVYHMEIDLYKNDGSILFADSPYLKTTNGKSTTIIARGFSTITSFEQINSTHVAAVDHSLHCVKMVNREDNSVRVLAGICGSNRESYGYVDGKLGYAKFRQPWGIELDPKTPGRLLVTDFDNKALRSIEISTGVVGTVIKSGFRSARSITWKGSDLLVANIYDVSEVQWTGNDSVTNTRIAGSTAGSTNGDFGISKFHTIHDIHRIQDGLYIAVDSSNRRLRVLDFFRRRVVPVCVGRGRVCDRGSPVGNYPSSILKVGANVLVGVSSSIIQLFGYQCYAENVTVYVTPYKERADVTLNSDDLGAFPPGEYQFKRKYGSDSCILYVNVYDSPIVRTVTFRSEYDVACATLESHISTAFLQSVLAQRNTEFQKLCGKNCKMSSRLQPWFTCEKGQLTVNWPTDTVYPVDVKKAPETFSSPLKERLKSSPLRNAEMVILSHIPPLVRPKRNSNGETVQIVVSSKCADKVTTYQMVSDTCV